MSVSAIGVFTHLFLITIFCQTIDQVNTLRCSHLCSIGPIRLGSPNPIKNPCNTVDINTTTSVCSVFLTINFETSFIHGNLREKPRSTETLSILDLSSMMLPTKTISFINYYCATADDCDQEFVVETISSSKWLQLNETQVRTDITSLLFKMNSSTEELTCNDDSICSWDQYCYAQITQNSSDSQTSVIAFNNEYPCINASSPQVNIEQSFSTPGDNQALKLQIHCNKNECTKKTTLKQVYDIFRNDFNLPLNYSAYISPPNRSNRLHNFISIPMLLYFIWMYVT